MKLLDTAAGGLALVAGALLAGQAALAETYLRKGSQEIEVVDRGGKLYCTRVSDGYEMCNGMARAGDNTYKGRTMKHPDMPRFMTFNGTVVIGASSLKIKGCAVGICDSETWTKK